MSGFYLKGHEKQSNCFMQGNIHTHGYTCLRVHTNIYCLGLNGLTAFHVHIHYRCICTHIRIHTYITDKPVALRHILPRKRSQDRAIRNPSIWRTGSRSRPRKETRGSSSREEESRRSVPLKPGESTGPEEVAGYIESY